MEARWVHIPKVVGSNPTSAILRGSSTDRTLKRCHVPSDTDSNYSFFNDHEEIEGSTPSHATHTVSRSKSNQRLKVSRLGVKAGDTEC